MKIRFYVLLGLTSVFLWNCSNQSDRGKVKVTDNLIEQQEDGTISLKLASAGCYHDVADPSNNTAEWNVDISKPGRYKVWLSSSTRDTIDLNYSNKVRVNLPDCQLEGLPACDKIIRKSKDASYPYYRADSYMGSVYISQPGECSIQVISEKVVPVAPVTQAESLSYNSTLMELILSPATN